MEITDHLFYTASCPPDSHHQNGETEVGSEVMLRSPSNKPCSELEATVLGSRLVSFIITSTPSSKVQVPGDI